MLLLKVKPKVTKEFLKKYKSVYHKDYNPDLIQTICSYKLLDSETLKPVLFEVKEFNYELEKMEIIKQEKIYRAKHVNSMLKSGVKIDIISDKDLKDFKQKQAKFEDMIKKARIEGFNEGVKSVEK